MPSSVQPPAAEAEHTPFADVQTLPPPSASILPVTSSRPAMVDVPVPRVFIRFPTVDVPVWYVAPNTAKSRAGDVVPIPIFPFGSI